MAGQQVQLEMVGGDDPRRRHRALAHEFRDAGPHEHAAFAIADDRIAAIAGVRIGGFHLADRVEDRLPGRDRPDIAGEDAVAGAEHAAIRDAVHHLADQIRVERFALPDAVSGVVGELHRMDRPHLAAQPLQREHRGRIADMAIGDMGLDGDEVHERRTDGRAEDMTVCRLGRVVRETQQLRSVWVS
jgi:hypothetical protein